MSRRPRVVQESREFLGQSLSLHATDYLALKKLISDGGDLAAVQAQKTAMDRAGRSLAEATADAVKANAGYRAVSATPSLDNGHPVAEDGSWRRLRRSWIRRCQSALGYGRQERAELN